MLSNVNDLFDINLLCGVAVGAVEVLGALLLRDTVQDEVVGGAQVLLLTFLQAFYTTNIRLNIFFLLTMMTMVGRTQVLLLTFLQAFYTPNIRLNIFFLLSMIMVGIM